MPTSNGGVRLAAVVGASALLGILVLGALGAPRVAAVDGSPDATLPDLPPITTITGGLGHWCLLGTDGSVWCWGNNSDGELGNGTTESSYGLPIRVTGLPAHVRQVVAFSSSTCALTESGAVWCWGANDWGQLGDGTTNPSHVPMAISGLESGVAELSRIGDPFGLCAIRSDGSGICWGDDMLGRLGGAEGQNGRPVPVTIVADQLTEIVGYNATTCALTDTGRVRCWGRLWVGAWSTEEGFADRGAARAAGFESGPVTPLGLSAGVIGLAAGGDVACAILSGGSVRCWSWGKDPEQVWPWEPGPTPETVDGLPGAIASVALAQGLAPWGCATSGDRAWCWGENSEGQLGDGTRVNRSAAVEVATPNIGQLEISYGVGTLALLRDGSLVMWGFGDPTPRSPFFAAPPPAQTTAYRESGPLEPPITTHIPTPADISTDPPVVGANLLLAALAMIAFTIAIELLNRTIAAQESLFRRWLAPLAAVGRLRERVTAGLAGRLGTGRSSRLVYGAKIMAIVLFYGVVFALLDPTWNPLSLTGLALVVLMALAVGMIGLSDDIASWAVARRYGVAQDLSVRAGGLMAALVSVIATRLLVLVPGVIIGAPEALEMNQQGLDRRRLGLVAAGGLGTILAIGGIAWLGTLATSALRTGDGATVDVLVGGLEALLLLVFAVAVQNTFVQLLAFRGTAGRALLNSHRVVWAAALLGVTFAFWHTLVNPRGDLASALGATNVQAFLATVGAVLAIAIVAWLATLGAQRNASGRISPPQAPPTLPAAGAGLHP